MSDVPVAPKSAAFYAAQPENRFHFKLDEDDTETVSLPRFEWIGPYTPARKRLTEYGVSNDITAESAQQLTKDLVMLLEPELGKIVSTWDGAQLDWLAVEWQKASGMALPESSASSSSSTNTKGPSKATSSTKVSASAASAAKTSTSKTSSSSSRTRAKAPRSSAS